jgi:beta-glucosidase
MEGVHNLLRCHAAAYHAIKERYPAALVGTADNMQVFAAPPDGTALDRWWARQISRLYNDAWPAALHSGVFRGPVGGKRFKHLAGTSDFNGINYYTRFYVRFPPRAGFVEREWGPDAMVSDGNYGEVYPRGLYQMIRRVLPYGKPIYITENGVPDAADRLRPGFLLDHLRQIWQAISFCYPVQGYYHWSLVDNFEWERGWTQRFGLIAFDPETQERTWRPSAHLYREICRLHDHRRYGPALCAGDVADHVAGGRSGVEMSVRPLSRLSVSCAIIAWLTAHFDTHASLAFWRKEHVRTLKMVHH